MTRCRVVLMLALAWTCATPPADAQVLPANEAGIQGTLRSMVSGQLTYSAVCGDFFYAPTFEALARPPKGQRDGFIPGTDVPKPGTTHLEKYQYRVEMMAPPSAKSPASCNGVPAGGSAQTFTITARPLPGFRGRSFQIDDQGKLIEIK